MGKTKTKARSVGDSPKPPITIRSTNPKVIDDNIAKLEKAIQASDVSANPSGTAEETLLSSIGIDGKKYDLGPSAANTSYDNTDSGLTADDVQSAIDEIIAISDVVITKNDDYVSSIYLQSCKKIGNIMSLYVVYSLASDIPDDSVLFTISGATIKADACALTCSNNGGIQGFLATNSVNNTINMLHQLGTGTSRFQMIILCE